MAVPEVFPSLAAFEALAARGNVVPVRVEVLADLETPVSAFLKLRRARPGEPAFLLESVEGGENVARYSFLGVGGRGTLSSRDGHATLHLDGQKSEFSVRPGRDPLHLIETVMGNYQYVAVPGLPRFCGGAVGFLGWDLVRFFENIGADHPASPGEGAARPGPRDDRGIDDVHLLFTDTMLIFDAVRHTITVLHNAHIDGQNERGTAIARAYESATSAIQSVLSALRDQKLEASALPVFEPVEAEPKSNFASRTEFEDAVRRCIEYIRAGDCVQIVPSQRFCVELHADPFAVYRALRHLSPAPYMVFYDAGDVQLIAASPEILVTEDAGRVLTRPLAGTRRRGADAAEDARLEAELLADPKERAEHVMLVDLARNDLGRVCRYGSVRVSNLMYVQKFSHVMHITSDVEGELEAGRTAFDVLRATFPAGTLSGAPKVRAMQIIDELEPTRRGPYGGAMGYFSFNGNLDTCITLRTIVVKDGMAYVQAGGGVVADSCPHAEYEETRNKARAALRAIQLAQGDLAPRAR